MTPGYLGEGYKTLAIGAPSPDLPNWSLTPPGNATLFYWGLNPQSYFPAAEEGTHYLNICTGGYGWDVSGTVSQSFAVTGGTDYTVSYYGAARDDTTEKIQADLSLSAGTGGVRTSPLLCRCHGHISLSLSRPPSMLPRR